MLTTEVEYARQLPDELRLIIGGFFNRASNLVELAPTADGELLQYQNVPQQVDAVGGEIELRREWRRGWFLAGSYSYQQARLGDVVDGERLTNSPNHLSAHRAQGRRPDRPHRRHRRQPAAGRVSPAHPHRGRDRPGGAVGLGVRNLLDGRHGHATGEDIDSGLVPQIGRLLYGSARVSF